MLAKDGFQYEARVPDLSLKYLNYKVVDSTAFKNNVLAKFESKNKSSNELSKDILKAKYKQGILFKRDSIKVYDDRQT